MVHPNDSQVTRQGKWMALHSKVMRHKQDQEYSRMRRQENWVLHKQGDKQYHGLTGSFVVPAECCNQP